ncbi:MAG: TolC family protein [Ferruginibacter sp.]
MKYTLASIIAFCLCLQSHAQQQMLTVEQAVAAALQNNYDIRLVRNDSVLAALNNSYAYAAFLPTLNAQGGLLYNNNNIRQKLADGSERKRNGVHSNNLTGNINLNWTIFDGFKMFATRDKLQEILTLGELTVRNQVVSTVSDVIKTYYNIVRQKQQVSAIEEQMKLNETRAELAEKKLSVGLGAKPELLQAKVDLNAQRSARLTELTLIEQLKDQLNQLMAMEQSTRYEVADSIPFKENLVVTDIMAQAETTSPALLMAKQNISIARLTLKEAKADRWPTVSFNSAYNFNRTINKEVVNNFSTLLNRNHGFNYGVSAVIPLFNGFNVRRQIKAAEIDIDYQTTLYEYQRYNINTAISIAYKDYELQKKTLALEEENILLARENVYIASERLRLGITTSIEFREAQQSLELANNRLIAARYNTKVAETELLRLKGDLVSSN